MPGKLNLKKAAALAITVAALSAPASLNASHAGQPCPPEGVQMVNWYCSVYWNTYGQPNFANQAACVEYYMPTCHDVYYYDAGPDSSVLRPD